MVGYDDEYGYESSTETYRKLITVSSIACGVQFGWALQLSLLTPYVQLLGVPHMWTSFVWLCGPISGLLVQPLVGYFSDNSTSRMGRRRPYIVAGAILVSVAVILIGFAADFGHMAGDKLHETVKTRAIVIYIIGFWILDVANNTLQGPCRAFLGDIANGDKAKAKTANAFFSFFMGLGSILGYSAGSYGKMHKLLPFTVTPACDVTCANLKTCLITGSVLLLILTFFAIMTVGERPGDGNTMHGESESPFLFFISLFKALKDMKKPMWILLAVTAVNWIAWFPWFTFNTDWMGKEVYGGNKDAAFERGVQAGSLGLMMNSVVLLVISLAIVFVPGKGKSVKILWGLGNLVMCLGLIMTLLVTKKAKSAMHYGPDGVALPPPSSVKAGALAIFSIMGFPLAVTFSIPFAMASMYCMAETDGPGQGLSLGVLNLAIVIPQMFVSVTAGPLAEAFGGSNLPDFMASAVFAFISAMMALFWLPTPPKEGNMGSLGMTGGGH